MRVWTTIARWVRGARRRGETGGLPLNVKEQEYWRSASL